MNHILPNFLIIGAARSGTTTLYKYLQEHPNIYLPASKRPEPHFFLKEQEYIQGINYYSKKYFSEWQDQIAIGEASTSYICHELVASRIKTHLPNVKLIAVLRHPVERAYSSYWHTVKSGLEILAFDETIRREKERSAELTEQSWQEIQPFAYVERGFYYKQLSAYFKYFSRSQMLILLFDDLIKSPLLVAQQVFNFLEVDKAVIPKNLGRVENSSTPASSKMSSETRMLLLEWYREDTDRLSSLLERDLSSWQK